MTGITKKEWVLVKPDVFNGRDWVYFKGLGVEFTIAGSEPAEFVLGEHTYRYVKTTPQVEFVTTTLEQEDMLKLRYGDQMVLMRVFHEIANNPLYIPELYERR